MSKLKQTLFYGRKHFPPECYGFNKVRNVMWYCLNGRLFS